MMIAEDDSSAFFVAMWQAMRVLSIKCERKKSPRALSASGIFSLCVIVRLKRFRHSVRARLPVGRGWRWRCKKCGRLKCDSKDHQRQKAELFSFLGCFL